MVLVLVFFGLITMGYLKVQVHGVLAVALLIYAFGYDIMFLRRVGKVGK